MLDNVINVKNALEARGVSLSGPCGAFQITKRVAWQLRDQGAGLLSKPNGNNCEGFATDYVVFKNGPAFDILGDGGNANIPQWAQDNDASLLARWVAPVDPGDDPPKVDTPPAPTPPPAAPLDIDRILAAIELASNAQIAATKEVTATLVDLRQSMQKSLKEALPAVLNGLGTVGVSSLSSLFKK